MINQTEKLGTALNDGIAIPVQNIAANSQSLSQQLGMINQQLYFGHNLSECSR